MIFDTHDNLRHYAAHFRDFDPVPLFDWLAEGAQAEPGVNVEFFGDKVFAKVLAYDTVTSEAVRWESHREYIDLQYGLSGGETIEWAATQELMSEGVYDTENDVQFYSPSPAKIFLPLHGNTFTFLFPSDGHKPMISDGKNVSIRKAVVKIHRTLMIR